MTTEELKRAFDICLDTHGCTDCPLLALEQQNGCDCRHNLFVSAIDLATEQEREIERLKEKCEELLNEKWDAQDDLDCYCDEMPDKIKQTQIDILNKANERLNVVSREFGDDCDLCGVSAVCSCRCKIDELIEEVQNAEDKG